jgi:hypothetical protein
MASSDEEMANNKFVGSTYCIMKKTQSKGSPHHTVSFRFLCDYADQYDQHMSFITRRLEILEDEIAVLISSLTPNFRLMYYFNSTSSSFLW